MMRLFKRLLTVTRYHSKPTILITKDAYNVIESTTKYSPEVETGGILIGYDKDNLVVDIRHATMPGPKAYHSSVKFVRDTEYCTGILHKLYFESGVDYVGEWHSHIIELPGVSYGDITTLTSISRDCSYNFKSFACIVALLKNENVSMIGYVVDKNYVYEAKIEIL